MRLPRFLTLALFTSLLAVVVVNVWRGLSGQGWNW